MNRPFAVQPSIGPASAWIYGEPGIDDLLNDPLVGLVLRRDGLNRQDLRTAVAAGRARLSPIRARESRAA